MFQETISDEYIVIQSGTSEGSQIKYRKDNYWYKKITEDMKEEQNICVLNY